MKTTNLILSLLFFAVLGTVLSLAIDIQPFYGLLLSGAAFLPMPTGVLGENIIPKTNLTDAEKKDLELIAKFDERIKKAQTELKRGLITLTGFEEKLKPINEALENQKNTTKSVEEMKGLIDGFYKEIELLKDANSKDVVQMTRKEAIGVAFKELMENKGYIEWVKNECKGTSPSIEVKYNLKSDEQAKYAISSGRTGTVLISNQSGIVEDPHVMRKLYMRDVLPTGPIDQPYLVHDKVTSFTNPALGIGENDAALETTMTTAEQTTSYKRIATFMDISKSAVRAVKWLTSHLSRRMPEDIKEHEDFQILFGDNVGNNVDGIFENATLLDLTGPSFIAGAVASVATYDSGAKAIVTFAAEHNLNNGQKITFAAATEATYNATFAVNIRTSKSIVIDVTYVVEADTSAWTATTKYGNYLAIDNATEVDVLNAAKAVQRVGRYMTTVHVINPIDASIIESLKDTTAQYIEGKIARTAGILYIDGIPCIETDAMKLGWGLSMDARNVAELLEFKALSVYAMSDATLEKINKVRYFANEEIVFPIYNPFLATYYNFATVKAALETA